MVVCYGYRVVYSDYLAGTVIQGMIQCCARMQYSAFTIFVVYCIIYVFYKLFFHVFLVFFSLLPPQIYGLVNAANETLHQA